MKLMIILCAFLSVQRYNQQKTEVKTNTGNQAAGSELIAHQQATKEITKQVANDTVLNNIQNRITKASFDGFAKGNTYKLNEIEGTLTAHKVKNENLKKYWIGYINYYKTLVGMKAKNKELAEKANKKGIEFLQRIKNKNSDDYALLALIKGLSYPFASPMQAPAISMEISRLIKKAIKADDSNFRAYYAQGSIDFYTPKRYGGGTKAEQSLLKAIDLPEKNIGNSKLPTWGKEESYDLLIRFYLRENKKKQAKAYFEKAKQLFPNNSLIKMHQSQFESE